MIQGGYSPKGDSYIFYCQSMQHNGGLSITRNHSSRDAYRPLQGYQMSVPVMGAGAMGGPLFDIQARGAL